MTHKRRSRSRKAAAGRRPERVVTQASSSTRPVRPLVRQILFRVFAVVGGVALAALVCELGLRLLDIKPERYPPPRLSAWDGRQFLEGDAAGGGRIKRPSPFSGVVMGEYVPGARFKVTYATNPRGYFDSDNSVLFTMNSLALRGEEIAAVKPPATYRILGLGDSFTLGVGVKDDDTFLHRLQLALNAGPPRPEHFEVLNAGVAGYNTRDEVVYLERRWLSLDPDLVLIVFYINDAYDDAAILNMGQGLAIRDEPSTLGHYSFLYDLVQHTWRKRQESKDLEAYYHQVYFTDAQNFLTHPGEFKMDWTVSRAALEHAAQLTRERNIKFGVVMFPELYRLKGGYPFLPVHALVRETCERAGVPFLDLLDTFRGQDDASLWVHPSDHHPNERAHGLAEGAIEQFIRKTFLAPEPQRDGARQN
jgi:hypothetical protein